MTDAAAPSSSPLQFSPVDSVAAPAPADPPPPDSPDQTIGSIHANIQDARKHTAMVRDYFMQIANLMPQHNTKIRRTLLFLKEIDTEIQNDYRRFLVAVNPPMLRRFPAGMKPAPQQSPTAPPTKPSAKPADAPPAADAPPSASPPSTPPSTPPASEASTCSDTTTPPMNVTVAS